MPGGAATYRYWPDGLERGRLGLIRFFGHRAKGGYGVPHEPTVEAGEGDITATA